MDKACPHRAVPALGRSHHERARDGLAPHVHVVFELSLIESGELDWSVDDVDYRIPAGSIILSRPGEQHGASATATQPCVLRWIQVDQQRYPQREQLAALAALHGHVWPGANHLLPHLDAIMQECRRPRNDSAGIIEAHLFLLIAGCLRLASDAHMSDDGLPESLQRVCNHLRRQLDRPLVISECCQAGGIGRSRLHRLFRLYMQCSPGAWHHRLRIDHAKRRLTAGHSVTETAMELGYSSSQHFARVFKRHCGIAPTAWAKKHAP